VQEVVLKQFGKDCMVCVACLIEGVAALAGGTGYKSEPVSIRSERKQAVSNLLKRETAKKSHGSAPNVDERNMAD
jgi:hypothetical protein